jgi:hypothetical protein
MKPDSEISPAGRRWRRAQERKLSGLTRLELWLPDFDDLCEQLHDERYLADWRGDDRDAVAAALQRLLGDWVTLTREAGDPVRRAMVKARIGADSSPPKAELEKRIQRRDENLCLASQIVRYDGTKTGAAKIAESYRQFRKGAWLRLRLDDSCPPDRGEVEQFFFEALKAWDAAVTPAQMIEALKRGAT